MAKLTKAQKEARQSAITRLREVLKPGDTVYTIVRRVGRTGMSRDITPLTFRNGEPFYLGRLAAEALGWSIGDKDHGVRINGCGMDMSFHLVYTLAATIFDADCINGQCLAPVPDSLVTRSRGYWLTERNL